MPHSIPSGLNQEHILRTLADLDAGILHPFGAPTGYELIYNGNRYAPKAVIGLAFRYAIGRILQPEEFSGGEGPGQANFVLRKLGFTVHKKEKEMVDQEKTLGKDWTYEEVSLIVANYFQMLQSEILGIPSKTPNQRKSLVPKLQSRSEVSIKLMHRIVSGVLVGLGLPYIEGYAPLGNFQRVLANEVEAYLDQHIGLLDKLANAPKLNPNQYIPSSTPNLNRIIVEPPQKGIAPKPSYKPWLSRKCRKIDFAERDAANRQLGTIGENFVYDLERYRLKKAGRDDLAQKVIWASKEIGDGLGFDIISFDDADDSERMIEVKTTALGKFFPFYLSRNEVLCSEDLSNQYHLFRVFDFGRSPRLYILHGSLQNLVKLEPVLYQATV